MRALGPFSVLALAAAAATLASAGDQNLLTNPAFARPINTAMAPTVRASGASGETTAPPAAHRGRR